MTESLSALHNSPFKYSDFNLPRYLNTGPMFTLSAMHYPNGRFYDDGNAKEDGEKVSVDMTLPDVNLAAISAGLNVLYVGNRGNGKSQLMEDVIGTYFGGDAIRVRGDKDLNMKGFLRQLNFSDLSKALQSGASPKSIYELTKKFQAHVVIMDEINRCPPIIQQQFMNVADGYFEWDGVKYPMGNGNVVGIASANVGNGYIGTFKMDDALKDRFHFCVPFNWYKPTIEDIDTILGGPLKPDDYKVKLDPRVVDAKAKKGVFKHLQTLKKLTHQRVDERDLMDILPEWNILSDLLIKGMDYCSIAKVNHSKDNLGNWPKICSKSGVLTDGNDAKTSVACKRYPGLCSKVKPISPRSAQGYILLASSIENIAELKAGKSLYIPSFDSYMNAFEAGSSHSLGINSSWVTQECYESRIVAIKEIREQLEKMISEREMEIVKDYSSAVFGNLTQTQLETYTEEWGWFSTMLSTLNKRAIKKQGNSGEEYGKDFEKEVFSGKSN